MVGKKDSLAVEADSAEEEAESAVEEADSTAEEVDSAASLQIPPEEHWPLTLARLLQIPPEDAEELAGTWIGSRADAKELRGGEAWR
ncbi:unnamed protein product [Miscanthus lutarioriparius]|uniref:Uncharacterized protein n=1 Tax=Miscanthus lutarioriparius TaxID=422564 RepID=A0A811NWJ3_9POAL|nr:unnamed protein product [Miscanthus lutarioriparius]CAD6231017.1 unnamed protein product [Miscanthus lutarioriparius]